MDIIAAGPHLPLTTATLARQCHVGVRTLQEGSNDTSAHRWGFTHLGSFAAAHK
jgi:hypothetical protein